MDHVQLGRTGLRVSRLCLGTMTFGSQCDERRSTEILDTAFAAGITFIDTADVYPFNSPWELKGESERIVGNWMQGRRDQVVIATKAGLPMGPRPWESGHSRKHLIEAAEASLRRLRTDTIDIFQLHTPDRSTPIDETLRALDDLVRAGKVRYVGCSNHLAYEVARAVGRSELLGLARFDVVQPRYNLLFRQVERELLPLCAEEGIGVIPFNPLAGGLLTGKYPPGSAPVAGQRFALGTAAKERYWHESAFATVELLRPFADEAGMSLAQLSIAWMLARPTVTAPIIGASRPEQLADAARAHLSPRRRPDGATR